MEADQHFYNINCPHCRIGIQVGKNEINCGIFRCAVMKKDCGIYKANQQSNPHASKDELERLKALDCYWGCGKPFRVQKINDNEVAVTVCDYI